MDRVLKIFVLLMLMLRNSAEGPVDEHSGVEVMVTAVAADLSTQAVQFQLQPALTNLSTDDPKKKDAPDILTEPCAECIWQVTVKVNGTMTILVDKHSLIVFSVNSYEAPVIVPLPECNVTSTIHESSDQSIVVLCDHSHSNSPPKIWRYNYDSGAVIEIPLLSATNELLGRGALFGFPSGSTGPILTHIMFPLVEKPWFLMVYNLANGFSQPVEVYPLECLAVRQITIIDHLGKHFALIHCSAVEDSSMIDLLVFANLAESNFMVQFDLQSAGISYSPYTAVIHCIPSSSFCAIALQDSPRIVVLNLTSGTFRTLPLTNVAEDAILVGDSCVMYSSVGGLYWFSPTLVFSNDGTDHSPELVGSSTGTCFPPTCPRFQAINGSYVIGTEIHSAMRSLVVHACDGGARLEGRVEIDITPSWYLPFIGQLNSELVDPSSPSIPQLTHPPIVDASLSSTLHSTNQPSILPDKSTDATPSGLSTRTVAALSAATVVIIVAFIAATFVIVGAAIYHKRGVADTKLHAPTQADQQQEMPTLVVEPVQHGHCYPVTNHFR